MTSTPRRLPASAAVWPGIVLEKRLRSITVAMFISRLARKKREKSFISGSMQVHTVAFAFCPEWGSSLRSDIVMLQRTQSGKSEVVSTKNDTRCDVAFFSGAEIPCFYNLLICEAGAPCACFNCVMRKTHGSLAT